MLKFTLKIAINAPRITHRRLHDDGFVKPKHVRAFIAIFNVNFNILKQFMCALVGQIKDLISTFPFFKINSISALFLRLLIQ